MITYTIGGGGGAICRGIPSLDVAFSILRDMVRYEDDRYKDEPDGSGNVRAQVEVTFDYIEDEPEKYWHVTNRHGRTDMVISEEHRCDHCHQIRTGGW
jgi:hypothetical protein